jgi:hypothetical protein
MSSGWEERGSRICAFEVSVADLNCGQVERRRRRVAVTAPATPAAMPISRAPGRDGPVKEID